MYKENELTPTQLGIGIIIMVTVLCFFFGMSIWWIAHFGTWWVQPEVTTGLSILDWALSPILLFVLPITFPLAVGRGVLWVLDKLTEKKP